MLFFEILWWVSCFVIVIGLLNVPEFLELNRSFDLEEDDEGAAGYILLRLLIRIVLLILPAVCILFFIYLFNLAPETFRFLGLTPSPRPPFSLPENYLGGGPVTWIIFIIFWATVAVSVVWGISSMCRVVVVYIKHWGRR